MTRTHRFVVLVLDGVGIGQAPDAAAYGDEGSHTLGNLARVERLSLPNLTRLGLGNITPLEGIPPTRAPRAHYGRMREVSAGKDSTTGHWELAGVWLERPFPTYPRGFPEELLVRFRARTGCEGVLGNKVASGTAILQELGDAHLRTGWPIVYTSADSVFQIAAHVDVIPLEVQYRYGQIAREEVCVGEDAVGRVIVRPFAGSSGAYTRLSAYRKDFALRPPKPTVMERLQQAGIRTIGIGKIGDLYAEVGFDRLQKTASNAEGLAQTRQALRAELGPAFIMTNLVDFDQLYGHRNDTRGFREALEAFDRALPELLNAMRPGDVLVITADHGNDPTTPSTDHSRELVPLLVYQAGARGIGRDLGLRQTFSDLAATVADFFAVPYDGPGQSFATVLEHALMTS
ncbi:MAG: phosphopentomutase [Bacteroidota bacterium]|nr:phosphopentomutase [Bacteroidota bacterium]